MNRGGVGARSLNIELQAALNPAGERKVSGSDSGPLHPATRSCRPRIDYDKKSTTATLAISHVDPEAGEVKASLDGRSVDLRLR